LELLARAKARERNKSCSNRKGVIFFLFADNMLLHLKYSNDFTKKFLELINPFSNLTGYKINIQKPVAFLYTRPRKKSEKPFHSQ
jgi:hypothetical protein